MSQMTVKVAAKDGSRQTFEVKGDVVIVQLSNDKLETKFELVYDKELKRNIWAISEKGKIVQSTMGQNFIGLWVTTKGYFIHVLGLQEAYIVTETGQKLAQCEIRPDGQTELVGRLQERQRGEEKTTSGGKTWPIVLV